jgi:RNase H-like domain found in reverse transcriptase
MKKGRKPGLIGHEWQEPQQRAFEELIDRFTTAPLLRHYDPKLPLRLETDASHWALAGILSQPFENQWHPIAFFSRRFTEAEINYQVYDKEMLAIVASFEHWRHYLDGAVDTEVYTDHQNLKKFMEQTQLNGRQTRWLIKLLPYDFRLFYRKGTLNPADAPSRRPDYLHLQFGN